MGLPASAEVQAFLTAAGFPAVTFNLDGFIKSAIAELSRRTGYQPFFASDTATARKYDPITRGGYLKLDCGFVGNPVVTVLSTTQTLDTDYYLRPANSPSENRPYEAIRFAHSRFTGTIGVHRNSIQVSAKWGFCLESDVSQTGVFADIWHGLVSRAAALAIQGYLTGKVSVNGLKWTDYEVSEDFGSQMEAIKSISIKNESSWNGDFDDVCHRYNRVHAWV